MYCPHNSGQFNHPLEGSFIILLSTLGDSDLFILDSNDPVADTLRGFFMRDDDACHTVELSQIAEQVLLGLFIESRGRFIKQQYLRPCEHSSRDRDALYLTFAETAAALGYHGVETVFELSYEAVGAGYPRGLHDISLCGVGSDEGDVLPQRPREQKVALRHIREHPSQTLIDGIFLTAAFYIDLAAGRLVHAQQELEQGALPYSGDALDRDEIALFDRQARVIEYLVLAVREADVIKADLFHPVIQPADVYAAVGGFFIRYFFELDYAFGRREGVEVGREYIRYALYRRAYLADKGDDLCQHAVGYRLDEQHISAPAHSPDESERKHRGHGRAREQREDVPLAFDAIIIALQFLRERRHLVLSVECLYHQERAEALLHERLYLAVRRLHFLMQALGVRLEQSRSRAYQRASDHEYKSEQRVDTHQYIENADELDDEENDVRDDVGYRRGHDADIAVEAVHQLAGMVSRYIRVVLVEYMRERFQPHGILELRRHYEHKITRDYQRNYLDDGHGEEQSSVQYDRVQIAPISGGVHELTRVYRAVYTDKSVARVDHRENYYIEKLRP